MNFTKLIRIVFVVALAFPMPVVAREKACVVNPPSWDKKVTLSLKGSSLHKASKPLFDQSNLNFVGFGVEDKTINLEIENKTLKSVIEKLEADQKIKFIQNGNVLAAYPSNKAYLYRIPRSKNYQGKCISIDFLETKLSNVLRIIESLSKKTFNDFPPSLVKNKKVTIRLINVPWDQALDLSLMQHNLQAKVKGDSIAIEEYPAIAKPAPWNSLSGD